MKIITKCGVTGLLAAITLTTLNGCASMMSHSGANQGYYPGARASTHVITDNNISWALKPLALLDLPFSAVLDTLLLPWDYAHANDDKSIGSIRERVRRSEQQNKTNVVLAYPVLRKVSSPQP
ncbi:YceK/YidQ family lipoprotein [Enterobacteriaceae bacterium LUAb1]